MKPTVSKRPARVAERVKEELMRLLLKGKLRDPETVGVYVSFVAVSGDLKLARVYVRLTEAEPSETAKRTAVRAMNRACGFLRRQIAPSLQLRHSPELVFQWDEQPDRAARVEELLAEIGRERRDERG
jgi:ribosome-binding factor A